MSTMTTVTNEHAVLSETLSIPKGYKGTEAGIIPKAWEVNTVGDAFVVCNNLRLPISQKARERMTGPYPYYGPTGVQDHINEFRVDGEYVLIGEDGDHFLKWQKAPMTLFVTGKFNVNNHAHLVKGINNESRWFYHFFAHRDLTPYLTRQGAGRYKLTKNALVEIPCALPPRNEQVAISIALDDVEALVTSLDDLIAKKRATRQATMQQLLAGKAYPMKRIGELADVDPESLSAKTTPEFKFNYVSLEDVEKGTLKGYTEQIFATAPSRARRILRKGDVVVSTVRPNLQSHFLFTDQMHNAVCSTGFAVLRSKRELMWPAFLFFHMFTHPITQQIERILAGSNYPAINSSDVRMLQVPCPSIEEQRAIATVLTDMDAEIAALERCRDKTKAIKQGMMQALLTGRIRLVKPGAKT